MKQRSPTLEGFRAILRRPSFALAEITWRWSFGIAAGLLLAFSFLEYLDTLPVTSGDLLLLKTRHPTLISQAIVHIFRGSSFRLVEAAIVLALALGAGWIGIASLARAATLRAMLDYFRSLDSAQITQKEAPGWRLHSLVGLNFFRVAGALAALLGALAAFVLGGAASSPKSPAPGAAFLIIIAVTMLVWFVWSGVNWFLSLAAIFVVADGQDTFGSVAAAVDLCRTRTGSVLAAGTWFGLAHVTAFVVATSVVAFPLSFASVLPGGVVLGGVLLVTLLYFAVVDWLYIGRLAAYVAILELPDMPPVLAGQPLLPSIEPARVDPEELILSDVPLAANN